MADTTTEASFLFLSFDESRYIVTTKIRAATDEIRIMIFKIFLFAFFTYKNQLAKKYTHGLYHLEDETPLIVHPGIGTTKISARFGVLPTIELIELTI